MKFEDLVHHFEAAYVPHLAAPTRSKYASLLQNHVKPAFSELAVEEIDTKRIDAWLASKTHDGLSWATRADLRNLISSIFTRAEIWELYDGKNPAKRANPGRKKPLYEKRKLSTEETRKLLTMLPDDFRLVCMVALFCGLRISEVLGLCWRHVDFTRGHLLIRQRYYRGDMDSPKSLNGTRDIPFGHLAPLLRRMYPGAKYADDFVFSVTMSKGPTRSEESMRRGFLRPAAEKLGLYYPGFGFHSFRREAVTSISSKAGAIQACRVAGHSRVDTTLLYGLDDYVLQQAAIESMQEAYMGMLRVPK